MTMPWRICYRITQHNSISLAKYTNHIRYFILQLKFSNSLNLYLSHLILILVFFCLLCSLSSYFVKFQILESERQAKWHYVQQTEELATEVKKLKAEVGTSSSDVYKQGDQTIFIPSANKDHSVHTWWLFVVCLYICLLFFHTSVRCLSIHLSVVCPYICLLFVHTSVHYMSICLVFSSTPS